MIPKECCRGLLLETKLNRMIQNRIVLISDSICAISQKPTEYHQEFWKHYNVLKRTPLDEKLIQDLEEDISLQEQFEKKK
jgi:hypothetical protein